MTRELYDFVVEMTRIGNRAVTKAQEENRRLGIPNVYSRRGKVIYELPDGTITTENPFLKEEAQKKTGEAA